jgi:hypothetical protein
MRRRFRRLWACAFLLPLIFVLGVLLDGLNVKLADLTAVQPPPNERIGALHVHTVASDGSGTVPELVADARQSGLSFLALTDHNVTVDESVIASAPPDFAILAGEELSTNSGHFVTFGVPSGWPRPPTADAARLLAATHAAGGVNILAHPLSRHIQWSDWNTTNFDGFEVWNGDAVWRMNNLLDMAVAVILYPLNGRLALLRLSRTPDREFAKWDQILAQRPMPGMCGTDAHANLPIGFGASWHFPSYLAHFSVAREHVRLGLQTGGGNPQHASGAEIVDALMHGHAYCAIDAIYPANGFEERISTGGASGQSGDFLTWAGAGRIELSVPAGASQPRIRIFRDGQPIVDRQAWKIDEPLPGPGRYRAEVFLRQPGVTGWRRWTLWIFSSPIYVMPPGAASVAPAGTPPAAAR